MAFADQELPKIETFAFNHCSDIATNEIGEYLDVIDDLLHHPTIGHLKFQGDKEETLFAVFEKVGRKYGNLTSLSLNFSNRFKKVEFRSFVFYIFVRHVDKKLSVAWIQILSTRR